MLIKKALYDMCVDENISEVQWDNIDFYAY